MSGKSRLSGAALLIGWLLLSACHEEPAPSRLCFTPRPSASEPVRPNTWVKLLIRLELATDGVRATRTCTGDPIRWRAPALSCTIRSPELQAPAPVPVTAQSVFERALPGDRRLVWIATHRFANGEGFGPIALAHILPTGVEVEAIGSLRMRTSRFNLELWTIEQRSIIVASGETCLREDDPSSCQRAAALLVAQEKSLIYEPILDAASGVCVDEAFFELAREDDDSLAGGKKRHYALSTNLSHDPRYVVVTEQARITESDPHAAATSSPPVRRIDAQRFIHARDGRLISRQSPLWTRILPSAGNFVDPAP